MKTVKTMVALAEEYLSYRRNLGYALKIEGDLLLRFARFAEQVKHRGPLTTEIAIKWAKLPNNVDPLYWARRLDIVRRFAKYRALFEPETEIPPEGVLGPSYRRKPPYIYSVEEIATLLQAASELGPPGGLKPQTFKTLFGLLVSTGLRISEALNLNKEDIDFENDLLIVTSGKFKKSRLIPLHPVLL